MQFQIIVPTILETEITGFVGAGERQQGKALWRAELWRGEPVRIKRDGEPVAFGEAPKHAQRLAIQTHELFEKAARLANPPKPPVQVNVTMGRI